MNRLIENTVFSGFITAWRLATVPTRRSPESVNATTDGVVRPPSAFSRISGSPPSSTAIAEFVVPRSIPIVFAICYLAPSSLFKLRNLSERLADVCARDSTASRAPRRRPRRAVLGAAQLQEARLARAASRRRCRRPGPCRSGPRRRRRTAATCFASSSSRIPCGIRPSIPQVTALHHRGRRCPRSDSALLVPLGTSSSSRFGPDDAVGARRGERVAGAAVVGEQLLAPRGRWEATLTVAASWSPSLPRAIHGIATMQIAAKIPKRTNGRLLMRPETYRLRTGGARGTTGTSGAGRTPRSAASAGRRGGRG